MRVLVIDKEVKAKIAKVIAYAEKHRIVLAALEKLKAGVARPLGNNPSLSCQIPMGYRVTFTIEEQPFGWCRHISISVDGTGWPNPVAVEAIMQEFGFSTLDNCEGSYLEKNVRAINVVELLNKKRKAKK